MSLNHRHWHIRSWRANSKKRSARDIDWVVTLWSKARAESPCTLISRLTRAACTSMFPARSSVAMPSRSSDGEQLQTAQRLQPQQLQYSATVLVRAALSATSTRLRSTRSPCCASTTPCTVLDTPPRCLAERRLPSASAPPRAMMVRAD